MKIKLWQVIAIIIISIPLIAYIDTIRTGTYPFQQYFAICCWEAGILVIGIAIGKIIESNKSKKGDKLK